MKICLEIYYRLGLVVFDLFYHIPVGCHCILKVIAYFIYSQHYIYLSVRPSAQDIIESPAACI